MWNKAPLVVLAAAVWAAIAPVEAQTRPRPRSRPPSDTVSVYEREVFQYSREGRPDPFRSLVRGSELGLRVDDLTLAGVVYHSDPARSVAILAQSGAARRIRARVGERVGGIRIVAIRPRSVDVVIEELGVARRETLELRPAAKKEGSS